jgi:adenylate kinase family enzyme
MKRILIIGSGGAGKSTLAKKLAKRLALPCIHLDQLFWKPGWVETDPQEFDKKLKKILRTKAWVIDGNYGRTQELRTQYADTVIFLDFSRTLCLWRALWRMLGSYGRSRSDMARGCPEHFEFAFFKWIWNYPKFGKLEALRRLEKVSKSKRIIFLRNSQELDLFFERLPVT